MAVTSSPAGPPPSSPMIVAEVTKNWEQGQPVTAGLLQYEFEKVIAVNLRRGFRLHSFALSQVVTGETSMMETIIAVFEREQPQRPTLPRGV